MKTIVGFGQNLLYPETAFLLGLARSLKEYSIAINIGAGEGISATAILEGAQHLHHFKLLSVDLELCENETALIGQLGLADGDRYMQVVQHSNDFAQTFDKAPHLVFVDGSHEYEQALIDMNTWAERMVDGGLLIAHDYQDPRQEGVTRAIREWRKSHKDWTRIGQVLYVVAFRKPGGEDWTLQRDL